MKNSPLHRPIVGVGIMIFKNKKLLMGRRLSKLGFGTYGWLGGHVEYGETLKEAAVREVYEESGLTVIDLKFVCTNTWIIDSQHYIDIEFTTAVTKTPVVREPNKIESWKWYPLDKLPSPLFPPCVVTLECYKNNTPYLA